MDISFVWFASVIRAAAPLMAGALFLVLAWDAWERRGTEGRLGPDFDARALRGGQARLVRDYELRRAGGLREQRPLWESKGVTHASCRDV